jgi:hypothetical protein
LKPSKIADYLDYRTITQIRNQENTEQLFKALFKGVHLMSRWRIPEGTQRVAVSMEDGVWIFLNSERPFPRVLDLLHKSISTAFTNDQRDLFIDIFLQLLGVQMLGLLEQLLQLFIDPFRWFGKNAVKTRKNPDMDDVE